MIKIATIFFTTISMFACSVVKNNDKYGIQYFIKNIYNDSDFVKSGSILPEPFQVKTNNLPSVITLKIVDPHFSNAAHAQIVPYLPTRLRFVKMEDLTEDLKKLEAEKIIVFESSKPFNNNDLNNMGFLTIFQLYIDSTRTKVYIHYSSKNAKKEGYFRCSSEIHLIKSKWKEIKSEVLDMN